MREEIKVVSDFSEEEKKRAIEFAAKQLVIELTYNDRQVKNLYGYMRDRVRELPCDIDPPEPSKSLRLRYNLNNDYTMKMVFGIIEDWFNTKRDPEVIVTVEDIKKYV